MNSSSYNIEQHSESFGLNGRYLSFSYYLGMSRKVVDPVKRGMSVWSVHITSLEIVSEKAHCYNIDSRGQSLAACDSVSGAMESSLLYLLLV